MMFNFDKIYLYVFIFIDFIYVQIVLFFFNYILHIYFFDFNPFQKHIFWNERRNLNINTKIRN